MEGLTNQFLKERKLSLRPRLKQQTRTQTLVYTRLRKCVGAHYY